MEEGWKGSPGGSHGRSGDSPGPLPLAVFPLPDPFRAQPLALDHSTGLQTQPLAATRELSLNDTTVRKCFLSASGPVFNRASGHTVPGPFIPQYHWQSRPHGGSDGPPSSVARCSVSCFYLDCETSKTPSNKTMRTSKTDDTHLQSWWNKINLENVCRDMSITTRPKESLNELHFT